MNTDLSDFTASQLQRAKAMDFVRFWKLQKKFAGDPNALHLAVRNFPFHHPRSLNLGLFEKAAIAVGTTIDSTFAGPLAQLKPLADAFVELVRPELLIGKIPGLRYVPFQVTVPAQTAGGSYAWLGEGAATPATESDFSTLALGRAKCGGLTILTEELVELSTPAAEKIILNELIQGTRRFMDAQFIDPAVAAVANVSPASITNGAGTSVSAGTSQANAQTDWQSLVTNFLATNPSVENLVVLMTPANAVALSRALNQPTLTMKGGTVHGIPVITSATVGARLIALDASQILIADEGDVEASISNSALVQLDSAPDNPATASTVYVSLFERNLVGFKMVRMVNWVRAATTAVRYVSAAAYV